MTMTQRLPEAPRPVPESPHCRRARASADPRARTRIRGGAVGLFALLYWAIDLIDRI